MRSSTAAQDAAILKKMRDLTLTVTINGSTVWGIKSFQTIAEMNDTPDQISLMGGTASRSVSFEIDHAHANAISPFQASLVPAAFPLPIGAGVVITVNFWPDLTHAGTPTYSATIFTGNVIAVDPIDAVSQITVTAQDVSYNLGGNISLPAAGIVLNGVLNASGGDFMWSPLVVIDLVLRGCGKYISAPPLLSGTDRSKYTILSVPYCGGIVPDVGTLVNPYAQTLTNPFLIGRTAGKFAPDVVGSGVSWFKQTVDLSAISDHLLWRADFWFKAIGGNAGTLLGGSGSNGTGPSVGLSTTTGNVTVLYPGGTLYTTPNIPANLDGNWHHLTVKSTCVSGLVTFTVICDGVTYTSTATAIGANPFVPNTGTLGGSGFEAGHPGNIQAVLFLEALEVVYVPTGAVGYVDPPSRYNQAAGMTSAITATTARISAIAPQTGLNAWQTIQSVAGAEGALCWFDEDGTFYFEPQKSWLARRVQASVRTFGASEAKNVAASYRADGFHKTVTATYTPVTAIASTAASPAYVSDTTIKIPPGISTQPIATTQLFYNPSPPARGASNVVGNSWFVAVAATSEGDPSAQTLPGFSMTITPTATGFNLTMFNPYPYTVALWNPTPGTIPQGPALIVHGTKIVVGDPVVVSDIGNANAKDDLQIADNPWRQDPVMAQTLVHNAARDCFTTIPTLQDIDVPGDPRLQLGDVITVSSPSIQTPGGLPCVVSKIQHNVDTSSDYRMTLGVRPLGPPTGWLMGVPGRSVMGVSTYHSLP